MFSLSLSRISDKSIVAKVFCARKRTRNDARFKSVREEVAVVRFQQSNSVRIGQSEFDCNVDVLDDRIVRAHNERVMIEEGDVVIAEKYNYCVFWFLPG